MASTFGQPPSTWVLPAAARLTPEGQAFAYDFDRMVLLLGTTFQAEQQEMARQTADLKRRTASR